MKKNIHFSRVLIGLQRQKLNINSELLAGALMDSFSSVIFAMHDGYC